MQPEAGCQKLSAKLWPVRRHGRIERAKGQEKADRSKPPEVHIGAFSEGPEFALRRNRMVPNGTIGDMRLH